VEDRLHAVDIAAIINPTLVSDGVAGGRLSKKGRPLWVDLADSDEDKEGLCHFTTATSATDVAQRPSLMRQSHASCHLRRDAAPFLPRVFETPCECLATPANVLTLLLRTCLGDFFASSSRVLGFCGDTSLVSPGQCQAIANDFCVVMPQGFRITLLEYGCGAVLFRAWSAPSRCPPLL
jgi:hypothetical protein